MEYKAHFCNQVSWVQKRGIVPKKALSHIQISSKEQIVSVRVPITITIIIVVVAAATNGAAATIGTS